MISTLPGERCRVDRGLETRQDAITSPADRMFHHPLTLPLRTRSNRPERLQNRHRPAFFLTLSPYKKQKIGSAPTNNTLRPSLKIAVL